MQSIDFWASVQRVGAVSHRGLALSALQTTCFPPARPPHSTMPETVASLLSRLSLDRYASTFEEEEIFDVSLLTSMGAEMVSE